MTSVQDLRPDVGAVPTLEQFGAEVEAFLGANAERTAGSDDFVWGKGDDDVAALEEMDPETEREQLGRAKEWRARRFDAGFGYLSGPVEYGGRGLPAEYEELYDTLEADYAVPNQSYLGVGLGMTAPTIAAHGTAEVRLRYLPALQRGDLVACQLFSEPDAGSDLAGVRTIAEADGDEWVVNGQKVWTSGAHYADVGQIVCRTDKAAAKHNGLTAFLVDMHAPGIEIRPLRQMTGGSSFNAVWLSDLRIPDSHRLGAVNAAWPVTLTTLMNERATAGSGRDMGIPSMTRLVETLRHFDLLDAALLRNELMVVYTHLELAKLTNQRSLAAAQSGSAPGPERSILKLAVTNALQRTSAFVGRVLGPRLIADTGEWGTFAWAKFVCGTPGLRIGGGTDEIQRNTIAERVLGLPKEPARHDPSEGERS